MFNALHQGSPIYLLDKATLTLKVGQVQSIGIPKPSLTQMFPLGTNTTIDISVVADGETIMLPNIPSNLSVATVNGIIAAESRECMATEVESIERITQQVIDNLEAHKQTVARCHELLKELNPQLAEEQKQKERIAQLESSLAAMQAGQNELKAMLAQALSTKNNKS